MSGYKQKLLLCACVLIIGVLSTGLHASDMDFGDCPAYFPTLLSDNGARHGTGDPNLFLGSLIDLEPNGLPSSAADGDDENNLDDEDGISFITDIMPGEAADINVTASASGLLDAWVDFTVDGDFNDPGEQILINYPLGAGVNLLTFNVPTDANLGDTYARFRLSTDGGLNFDGPASDGEVEDYKVLILDNPCNGKCFPGCNPTGPNTPEYDEWVFVDEPDCWCCERQCQGDADCAPETKSSIWVLINDLTVLKAAWNTPLEVAIENSTRTTGHVAKDVPWICADFDHLPEGKAAVRVGLEDLKILKANWNIPNGPEPNCPMPPTWFAAWDCPTQCYGDADCQAESKAEYRVGLDDLAILRAVWFTGVWPAHYGDFNYDPRADFDRNLIIDDDDTAIWETWRETPESEFPGPCPSQ